MKNLLLIFGLALLSVGASAKEIYQWYGGLQDPPGATLKDYSTNKLLPVDFLIRNGLRDYKDFKLTADRVKPTGKEAIWGTKVLEETGQDGITRTKLLLPNVVRTNFYMPVPGLEYLVYSPGFSYNRDPDQLVREGYLKNMGFVARLTMSHKKPDKILRFYEKLTELSPPIKNAYGMSVCRKDKKPVDQNKIPYGLWRLAQAYEQNRIFLVEGESTALSLWYHGIPAIAFGGASKWHDNYMKYLKNIKDIYVLLEPDTGGKVLLDCFRKISIEDQPDYQDFARRVKLVILGPYGDASDFHTAVFQNPSDPNDFKGLNDTQKKAQFTALFNKFVGQGVALTQPGYLLDSNTKKVRAIASAYNPSERAKWLKNKKYVEDVADKVLSDKPKAGSKTGEVYTKFDIIPNATLQDFSRKKNIPIDELRAQGFEDGIFPHARFGPLFGIKMYTYKASTNPNEKKVDYYRFRTSMDAAQPGQDRFPPFLFNEDGSLRASQQRVLYGIENLARYEKEGTVFIVEGESDTITMRHYGIPTLAIPGTLDINETLVAPLKNIDKIVVILELDSGGDHGMEAIVNKAPSLAKKALFIDFSFSPTAKDPSDKHVELTSSLPIDLETFYSDPKFSAQRSKIETLFRSFLEEGLKRSVYWRDIEGFFPDYLAARKKFDERQWKIYEAKKSQLLLDGRTGSCKAAPQEQCLKEQLIDKRYKPWPYVDFYSGITGKEMKVYGDEQGNDRPLVLEAP